MYGPRDFTSSMKAWRVEHRDETAAEPESCALAAPLPNPAVIYSPQGPNLTGGTERRQF